MNRSCLLLFSVGMIVALTAVPAGADSIPIGTLSFWSQYDPATGIFEMSYDMTNQTSATLLMTDEFMLYTVDGLPLEPGRLSIMYPTLVGPSQDGVGFTVNQLTYPPTYFGIKGFLSAADFTTSAGDFTASTQEWTSPLMLVGSDGSTAVTIEGAPYAVPEPSGTLLFGIGVAVTGVLRKKLQY